MGEIDIQDGAQARAYDGLSALEFEFDGIDDAEERASDDGGAAEEEAAAATGAEAEADAATEAPRDERPASERIDELFRRMGRQSELLEAILRFCETPRPLEAIEREVRHEQERHRSIFTVEGVVTQLEQAGALARTLENGEPYAYEAGDGDAEPQTEVIDGVEYLKRVEPPVAHWLATDDAKAALAARDPQTALEKLLASDAAYLPIYERVLEMCARDGGASMPELSRAIDSDPLCQSPRFYAAHFVNNLEACEALRWDGGWIATQAGLAGLERIAENAASE